MKKLIVAGVAFGLVLATGAFAANKPGTVIPPGVYLCKAGSSRMMLTLGEMTISGMNYSFKAQGGPATKGTYALTPAGYAWKGDIGAIKNAQIVESAPDATPGDYWFTYKASPTSSPTTASCVK